MTFVYVLCVIRIYCNVKKKIAVNRSAFKVAKIPKKVVFMNWVHSLFLARGKTEKIKTIGCSSDAILICVFLHWNLNIFPPNSRNEMNIYSHLVWYAATENKNVWNFFVHAVLCHAQNFYQRIYLLNVVA